MSSDHENHSSRPVLAVLHDLGSATPVTISGAARPVCDVVFVCDRSRPHVAATIDALREHARVVDVTGATPADITATVAALAPAGVLTFSEHQLARTAGIATALGLPFHDPAVVRTLVDKYAQRAALAAAGVQATRCVVVRTPQQAAAAIAEVGAPAVVKPRFGAGSTDTCRVAGADECAAMVERFLADAPGGREFVVEELLVGDPTCAGERWGDYVSVESVVQDGVIQTVCVTGKFPLAEPFRETGMLLPATLAPEQAAEVVALERRALRALDVRHGVTHTELKLTPDGPRVIEVNGRLGGYVGDILQRAGRFDLVGAAVRIALGMPVRVPPIRWRQLAYQYFVTPPAGRRTLVALDGVEAVAALPGVRAVDINAMPGQPVDWRAGTEGHLGVVHGTAPDHDALYAVVREIESRLHPTYA